MDKNERINYLLEKIQKIAEEEEQLEQPKEKPVEPARPVEEVMQKRIRKEEVTTAPTNDYYEVKRPIEQPAPFIPEKPQRRIEPTPPIVNPTFATEPIRRIEPRRRKESISRVLIITAIIIALLSLGLSSYQYSKSKDLISATSNIDMEKFSGVIEDIGSAQWVCLAERCTEYYPKETFFGEFCEDNFCTFQYQNKEQTFTKGSLETLNDKHTVFCKSFVCNTETIAREAVND